MTTSIHSLGSLASFLQQAYQRYQGDGPSLPVSPEPHVGEPHHMADPTLLSPELLAAWQRAHAAFSDGLVIKAIVTGWNRGGLLVRWDDLQGFVPASQLRHIPVFEDDDSRDEKLAHWVGEELDLKVIELDQGRNRLVLSERATIWGPKDGDRLLREIAPGQIRHGRVSNVCDFGAFVDLGGVDGLIHVSELSRGRVNHPREVLEIGQEVDVFVISVDQPSRRVALSTKRLSPDPWTLVDARYSVGQTLDATITNIVDFGAFARIEDGLEGLIHVSELGDPLVAHPSQVVAAGDRVQVAILRIDSSNHRLGLSLRQGRGVAAQHVSSDPQAALTGSAGAPQNVIGTSE